jgi:UDP-N-acetylmuramoyl-L-alanyl-D-glutamate--2,6-diaminopimelate ligase
LKTLAELLLPVPDLREIHGDTGIGIKNLRFDSRLVQAGDCFVAVRGATSDGHQFIDKAIENGAAAIVCEEMPGLFDVSDKSGIQIPHSVLVKDSAEALGLMAAAFYDYPSQELQVVGITGTNGKTTITTLLHQLYTALGYKAGLIGTVENRIGADIAPSTHTTPDAVSLQQLLRRMADAGCAMSCSWKPAAMPYTSGVSPEWNLPAPCLPT